jgi:AcrR family transcriptional regulator
MKYKIKSKDKNGEARSLGREARREQILQAAREVFAERGYHQATVSEMVKRCGVAQGTFYLYFKSKREVFEALLDQFTDSVFRTFFLPGAEMAITQEEIWSRLVVVSNWALEVFWQNQDLARLFLLEAPAREPGFAEKIDMIFQRLIEATAANLQLWMDKGLLRPADPRVIAICVAGMIERLIRLRLSGTLQGDLTAMVQELVKFELHGILRDPEKIFGKR